MFYRAPGRKACLVTMLFLATFAIAQQFLGNQTFASPNGPSDIFVADLNGDGKLDVVTTQSSSNAVTVFLNQGGGAFVDQGSAQYLTGNNPLRVVVADFDGDGKPDIATANCDSTTHAGSVSLLLGNGDGTFQNHQDLALPACPNSLGLMRGPAGTLPDLIVAEDDSNDIRLLTNKRGVFVLGTRIAAPAGFTFRGVSAADYNRDGKADIAAIQTPLAGGSSSVVLYLATATGFSPRTVMRIAGNALAANTVDVNGDGIADLLVPFTDAHGAHVEVLLNNGNAAVWARTTLSGFAGVGWKAASADFLHNGLRGIVVPVSNAAGSASDGYAAFSAATKISWNFPTVYPTESGANPWAAVAADMDGNSFADIAGVNLVGNQLSEFFQTFDFSPSGCDADSDTTNICAPTPGASVTSPFHLSAAAEPQDVSPDANVTPRLVVMKAYLDGKQVVSNSSGCIFISLCTEADIAATTGTHTLVANTWDNRGVLTQAKVTFIVSGVGPGSCAIPSAPGVKICSPVSGTTSGIAVAAAANGGTRAITLIRGYLDGKQILSSATGVLRGSVAATPGTHSFRVNAWNSAGAVFSRTVTVTVR